MATRISWTQTAFIAMLAVVVSHGAVRADDYTDPVRSLKDTAPVFFAEDTDRLAFNGAYGAEGDVGVAAEGAPADSAPAGDDGGFLSFFNNPEGYKGGRGLISLQGMSGMFINPTSGTLEQGQLTAQWCILYQSDVLAGASGASTGIEVIGNGLMVAYGITDYVEVGFYSVWALVDPSPFKTNGAEEMLNVMGPFARFRVLKDEGWMPEVSVGGIWLDGDASSDLLARQEVFIAASKYFPIDPEGFFLGFRVHTGVRFIWKHDGLPGSEDFGVMGYVGGELELPYSFWLIAEVSTQDDTIGPRLPHAFGLQWRPNEIIGITIGAVQPGDSRVLAFYFGIGLQYKF